MNILCPRNLLCFFALAGLTACSTQKKIGRSARTLLHSASLQTAHVGIHVADAATGKSLYDHQGDKYFVPASNTKIVTCYAAIKYLGKNLPGIRYRIDAENLYLYPTGDPTLLHPEFDRQRVLQFLQTSDKNLNLNLTAWKTTPWGSGWTWDGYDAAYMAERSALPMYGNTVRIGGRREEPQVTPAFFYGNIATDSLQEGNGYVAQVQRSMSGNQFKVLWRGAKANEVNIPFYTDNSKLAYLLLQDALRKPVRRDTTAYADTLATIRSVPTDSLLKPMMHRSDNFFAEQTLLMVSNELLKKFDEDDAIDTVLKTHLADLPQKPRWADGSGLSRYNLFTPQDFVHILQKIKTDAGMERVKEIFPTGGEGTLRNFYVSDSGFLYAKTGTLSGVVALSGYLYTAKNRLLLFSVLVNNHQASAIDVRRQVEAFLQRLRKKY